MAPEEDILHQEDVEEVIEEVIAENAGQGVGDYRGWVIGDPIVPTAQEKTAGSIYATLDRFDLENSWEFPDGESTLPQLVDVTISEGRDAARLTALVPMVLLVDGSAEVTYADAPDNAANVLSIGIEGGLNFAIGESVTDPQGDGVETTFDTVSRTSIKVLRAGEHVSMYVSVLAGEDLTVTALEFIVTRLV